MKSLKNIVLFVFGAVLIFLLAYSNSFNRGDYNTKRIVIKRGQTITYTIDLGKEGAIKRILQPNVYSVYLRVKAEEGSKLSCKAYSKDMQLFLSQGTKKGIWSELTENKILEPMSAKLIKNQNTLEKARQGHLPINVELKLLNKEKSVYDGKLLLMENGKEYGVINLKVLK